MKKIISLIFILFAYIFVAKQVYADTEAENSALETTQSITLPNQKLSSNGTLTVKNPSVKSNGEYNTIIYTSDSGTKTNNNEEINWTYDNLKE
ncbi:hypothetical protein [Enterococcus faecalis]|uniref:hypothetical protein n=1 Tax=Enterococcus faecalis TaxID=1351 RepID=UPI0003F71360|nr:hypothetical protein [Enterococcus faecalis]